MTVLFPPRLTASAEAILAAAARRGLRTVRLPSFELPAGLTAQHLHAGPSFADAVGAPLGIALLEAPADWLARLPGEFTRRAVRFMPIREAWALRYPVFAKSPNDKGIRAMIYSDGSRLPGADAVDPDTPVLVSDVTRFDAEVRLHVLDNAVVAASRYARDGRRDLGPAPTDALAFAADLLSAVGSTLPSAVVVDIGVVDGGWAVIEANAAWASGIYVADPDTALDVVLRAARPVAGLSERDRRFTRQPVE
ncbi:ATP-grasp domain-containing protein [Actinokineospora pegani]|uniref:ATP-grasp domain-containing protein n=1 Tax=Actinokineospora pegani TaxID=2654637 RepID=UPI0012E9B4FA|nr:ATP-grasp domain-containing protein [Actinokineospora pegani]